METVSINKIKMYIFIKAQTISTSFPKTLIVGCGGQWDTKRNLFCTAFLLGF